MMLTVRRIKTNTMHVMTTVVSVMRMNLRRTQTIVDTINLGWTWRHAHR